MCLRNEEMLYTQSNLPLSNIEIGQHVHQRRAEIDQVHGTFTIWCSDVKVLVLFFAAVHTIGLQQPDPYTHLATIVFSMKLSLSKPKSIYSKYSKYCI